ncbi:MAG: hypothetical protein GX066_01030, partial [Clostridiaceae bacterium]|nr:hypothetical protein [Clostridiaceae bacterium]
MGWRIFKKVVIMVLFHLLIFCLFLVPTLAAELSFVEENDTSIIYSGSWSRQYSSNASGSYYMRSNTKDSTVSLHFYGTGIKWIARTTNDSGLAEVIIDGIAETTVDLYSINTIEQQLVLHKTHLDRGNHTIEIKVTGNKRPESSNAYISVDAFEIIDSDDIIPPVAPGKPIAFSSNKLVELQWQPVSTEDIEGYNVYRSTSPDTGFVRLNQWLIKGVTTYSDVTPNNGTVYYYHVTSVDRVGNESIPSDTVSALPAVYNGYYEETATGLDYTGSWNRQSGGSPSGGYYNRSAEADATLPVSFYGTGIRWIGINDRYGGIAEETLDGEAEQVDLYNASSQYQVTVYEMTGLSNGIHNLIIRVTGNRNAASSGTYVYIDAIEVTGDVLKTGRVEENSVVMDYSGIWDTRPDSAHSG